MLIIENKRAGIIGFQGGVVTLLPGENRVKEDDWQKVLDAQDPTLQHYLDRDEIIIADQVSQEDDEGLPPRPRDVLRSSEASATVGASGGEASLQPSEVPGNAETARLTVEGTDDVAQLEAWAAGETRNSVKKALQARLSELRG